MTRKAMCIGLLILFIPLSLLSQPDTIRVACVGNSITDGISMSTKMYDSYPAALGRYMGDGYDVRNFGVSGRTMLKKGDFPLWDEALFADAINFSPHIVIILLGTNDTKPQNWVYKDEFLQDYYAMIDAFKVGANNPDIYACYPLPSFSDAWGIRNSVIVNDVIPMIDQIVDSVDVKLIDFNTPFLDKSHLMPDGIHPLIEGSDYMAQIVLKELTGRTIEEQKENNVALGKTASYAGNPLSEVTDGDAETNVSLNASDEPIVIDLETEQQVDIVRIDFTDFDLTSIGLVVVSSADSINWEVVADSLVTTESKLTNIFVTFPAVNSKYVKVLINHASAPVQLNQIKVYEVRTLHAPNLNWEVTSVTTRQTRVRLSLQRVTDQGEYMKLYKKTREDRPFDFVYSYRADPPEPQVSISFDKTNWFYSVSYKDDVAISSDTIAIVSKLPTSVETGQMQTQPVDYSLSENYPNPFNPETMIEFSIPKACRVAIEITDVRGRIVQILGDENYSRGTHRVKWNGSNKSGNRVSSGIYFYRLKIDGQPKNAKTMILLK